MLKEISELITSIPNDKELGKEIRKRRNLIKLELAVNDMYPKSTYQVSDNYFKLGYYQKVEGKLLNLLVEFGYKESFDDDEDSGRLYYYIKTKNK